MFDYLITRKCGNLLWFGLKIYVLCNLPANTLFLLLTASWKVGGSTQMDLSLGMGGAVHLTGGLNLSEK